MLEAKRIVLAGNLTVILGNNIAYHCTYTQIFRFSEVKIPTVCRKDPVGCVRHFVLSGKGCYVRNCHIF